MKFRNLALISTLALFSVILAISMASADCNLDQRILNLASTANAHAELYNASMTNPYSIQVCYNEIFNGRTYIPPVGTDAHACIGNNAILRLVTPTNAHAELVSYINPLDNYPINICYGDLICTNRTGSCNQTQGERIIVSLASQTNSHLASFSAYPNRICCSSLFANPSFCGDTICNGNENFITCQQDCPFITVCGDGIISGSEVCDGNNFGGQTCQTNGYPLGGTLLCINNCQTISLAGCTLPTCNNNGTCDPGETNANCPADCPIVPPVCDNDGTCDPGETNANCPADCPITPTCNNNGTCDPGETNANCPADCPIVPPVCDNDGTCDPGETNANCPADCPIIPPVCGNNICEPPTETNANCPQDCLLNPYCGDGNVDLNLNEACDNNNLAGKSCATQGFDSGTLSCYAPGASNECQFDTSNCANADGDDDDDDDDDDERGIVPKIVGLIREGGSILTGAAVEEEEGGKKLKAEESFLKKFFAFLQEGSFKMILLSLLLLIILMILLIALIAGRRKNSSKIGAIGGGQAKKDALSELPSKDSKK